MYDERTGLSGVDCPSSARESVSVLQLGRGALRLPSMECSGCFPVVGANGEPIDSLAADLESEPGSLRDVDGATWGDFNLRLDDVLIPVAAAGGNVAGQRKSGKSGHRDVVGAADAGFQHATAPYGDPQGAAQIVNAPRFSVSADPAKLDVDNPACAQFDSGGGVA